MSAETIIKDADVRMKKTVESIKHELGTIRTGKASPSILESVKVDAYGTQSPLNQVASVTTPDPKSLVVQPWDKSLLGEVVKGIQREDLGLNPIVDGDKVRVPIPALNEERRKELVKHAKKVVEDGKIAVRNVRRDANDHLKKMEKDKDITEDQMHDALGRVQKETDAHCADLDKLYEAKEKEVMEV